MMLLHSTLSRGELFVWELREYIYRIAGNFRMVFSYGGNFCIFRIVKHHPKFKKCENFLAQ